MSSEDEDMEYDMPLTLNKADSTQPKANPKYRRAYDDFQKWNNKMGATPVTEDVLLKYFSELAVKNKPSTLALYHSMLKQTLKVNDNVDISSYTTLIEFVKEKNAGYKPLKATVFTEEEVEKFLNEAPDDRWLDVKVVCIFGLNGVHSSNRLVNVLIDHIKVYDDLILVTIPKTDTSAKRTFTVTGTFFNTMHKYLLLRPENATINRFFLHYRDEKCSLTPIGRNKFFEMPRRVAKYLKLPKPELYSANSFRISTNNVAAGHTIAWESANCGAPEQQVQYSLDYQTGHLRTSTSSAIYSSPPDSVRSNTNQNKSYNRVDHRIDHRAGNKTDVESDHVCTISCGQVKCATEENEKGAFHAFAIMKPSDYEIIEVTPALFASDPICRWIVAYTHTIEPVSSYNADETFDDITRSTPNNVKVIQKYIRSNSTQLLAAYVVVYGVNCRCHKQNSDMFNFEMNEIKCEV